MSERAANHRKGRAPEPLFVLGPPRSFTSVISGMLGQHPEAYGFPEIHPFVVDRVGELFVYYRIAGPRRRDGLLRVVAQLYMERQTFEAIEQARIWLRERSGTRVVTLFRELIARVAPRVVVEKSVSTIWRWEHLVRLRCSFPHARFIHLTRHPRAQCESMLEVIQKEPRFKREMLDYTTEPPTIDPQILWYRHHSNIKRFLALIPKEQQLHIRGEETLQNPDLHLRRIAGWLGLRTHDAAIEDMKHPERSPFSVVGPLNAPFGNDPKFLLDPLLRPGRARPQCLDGPVSWRADVDGFRPEVRELATEFGYS
jgi:Sulfotransferase family